MLFAIFLLAENAVMPLIKKDYEGSRIRNWLDGQHNRCL